MASIIWAVVIRCSLVEMYNGSLTTTELCEREVVGTFEWMEDEIQPIIGGGEREVA